MNANASKQLAKMIKSGSAELIFEAEQSLSLIEACGKNQEFLAHNRFGELFGTVQWMAINQFILSVTKLYEKPNEHYPNRSLPSILNYIEQKAEHLEPQELHPVRCGFESLGVDTVDFDAADSSLKRSQLIVSIRDRMPDVGNSNSLCALKTLRDKKIAHPEDVDLDKIEKTTWEEAERLIVPAKAAVGIIGYAYLSTAYLDHKGSYLPSVDGSRVGRAMERLVKAARKGLHCSGGTAC